MHAQFYLVCEMFCYLVDFTLCNIIMMVICRVVSCEFFCQNPFRQNIGKTDKINAQFYLVYQMFCYLVDFTLCNIIMMVICRVVSCDFFCQNPFKQNISEIQRYVCSILYYLPHNSYVGYLPYAILS